MNVRYAINNALYSYHVPKVDFTQSFLLANKKGDFFHQGIERPTTKFQGFTYSDSKTLDKIKIIDEFFLDTRDVDFIELKGYETQRQYVEQSISHFSYPISPQNKKDDLMGEDGTLSYDSQGRVQENVESSVLVRPKDSIYLGPTGGIVYSVENYKGNFTIDLDIRKHDDFDTWGRIYKTYKKGNVLFVEYKKLLGDKVDYSMYFAIVLPTADYELKGEWVEKNYEYSKSRNSLSNWYVYRLLGAEITAPTTIYMAAGKSEKEVEDQLFLLQNHASELKEFDNVMQKEFLSDSHFSKPLTQDVHNAYDLSRLGLYKFLSKDLEGPLREGVVAGLPWFHQIWSRDELVSLRGFLELEDYPFIISKIYDYLEEINEETGQIPRLHKKGSFGSVDSVFWLAKRIEDLIFHLTEKNQLAKYLSLGDLKYIYSKLTKAFSNIIETYWDSETELLHTIQGDSWMDTLPNGDFLMDIQVQLLGFVSTMSVFAGIVNNKGDEEHYADLENLLKTKITSSYYSDGKLFNDLEHNYHNSNVFLAYYFYPSLFSSYEWEGIFDRALREMKCSWGGISSLSKDNQLFEKSYTGEDNKSYHHGDSWFWINNLAAIVLNDLNEKKYRSVISSILITSTKDILQFGTFGFGSEVSSAKNQESRGCLAQLWSSATYIELVHHLFNKEHL